MKSVILIDTYTLAKYTHGHIRCCKDQKGNPVKIGNGPAAVTGDKSCICHCEKSGRRREEDDPEVRRPALYIQLAFEEKRLNVASAEKSGPPDQFIGLRAFSF